MSSATPIPSKPRSRKACAAAAMIRVAVLGRLRPGAPRLRFRAPATSALTRFMTGVIHFALRGIIPPSSLIRFDVRGAGFRLRGRGHHARGRLHRPRRRAHPHALLAARGRAARGRRHLPRRQLARRAVRLDRRAARGAGVRGLRRRPARPRPVRGRALLRRRRRRVCRRHRRGDRDRQGAPSGPAGLPARPQRRRGHRLQLRARPPGRDRRADLRELRLPGPGARASCSSRSRGSATSRRSSGC